MPSRLQDEDYRMSGARLRKSAAHCIQILHRQLSELDASTELLGCIYDCMQDPDALMQLQDTDLLPDADTMDVNAVVNRVVDAIRALLVSARKRTINLQARLALAHHWLLHEDP